MVSLLLKSTGEWILYCVTERFDWGFSYTEIWSTANWWLCL